MKRKMIMAFMLMCASSGAVMAQNSYESGYSATSFGEAKASGSYGFSMTALPWKLAGDLYLGLVCRLVISIFAWWIVTIEVLSSR